MTAFISMGEGNQSAWSTEDTLLKVPLGVHVHGVTNGGVWAGTRLPNVKQPYCNVTLDI